MPLLTTVALSIALSMGALAPSSSASSPTCVTFANDGVGNRIEQTTAPVPTALWGSASWGCFIWTP